MTDKYILIDKIPVPTDDIKLWGMSFNSADRVVGKTNINDVTVSTVFLGLDHSFGQGNKPVLFETMIFGGEYDQEQWRYATWDEAAEGHKQAVALVSNKNTNQ